MAAKKRKKASSKSVSSKAVSKSAFVRGLSTTLPAKEVVAKAKAAGLKISDRYVHVIRSIAKRAGHKGNGAAPSPRRGGRPISSKRTFVLSLPSSLSATDVIERAKAQGMTLTTNYVYKIRSRGAAASSRPGNSAPRIDLAVKAGRGKGRERIVVSKAGDGSAQDERFVALVLDVGLSRAAALLDQLRDRVQGITV
jgi:hypothetical protein